MRRRRRSARSPWGFVAIGVGVALALGVPVARSVLTPSDVPLDLGTGTAVELAREPGARSVPSAPPSASAGDPSTPAASPDVADPGSTPRRPSSAAPTTPVTGSTSRRTGPSDDAGAAVPSSPRSTPSRSGAPGVPKPTPATVPRAAVTGVPDRVRIDDLSVDAPVVPVGVDDRGDLAIPEDVGTVGWYRFGPQPGAASGSVVLAGHVDSATQGVGELRALWSAEPGMLVHVDLADGRRLVYRVVSREIFVKGQVPLEALFSTRGASRLTLITCGGPFDETTRSYEDNVVVTAVPA